MAQLLAAGAFAGLALLSWRERQGKQSDNKPVSKTYEVRISMWRGQSCLVSGALAMEVGVEGLGPPVP